MLGLVAIAPTAAAAQGAPKLSLKPADAKLDEEFTRITGIRELADGRVLVADGKEVRLVVADLRAGTVEKIGRTGSGPGEYNRLNRIFALTRDSTLVGDAGNRRWLLMDGARIVATLSAEVPAVRAASATLLGTDRTGHALSTTFAPNRPGELNAFGESLFVVRTARSTGHADTVARLRPVSSRISVRRGSDGTVLGVAIQKPPFAADEQTLLFDDGWMAVARLEPYRVEWRSPDGRAALGAPLPFTKVRLDDAAKRSFLAELVASGARVDTAPSSRDDWPEVLPPFTADALVAAPDGRLLIQRTQTHAATATRYDMVDRSGVLAGVLAIAKNEQIIGFGPRAVYVAVTDDDGIQRIQRHPWP
jgi:hypothetical protein